LRISRCAPTCRCRRADSSVRQGIREAEWLANTELKWFPKDLIKKHGGRIEHSVASDDSLYLPAEKAEGIAADLRDRGHTVEPSPIDLI
jgi:hypothetical protein